MFLVSCGLFAQTIRELQFASPVPGNIFSGREYWYSVRPVSNGYVTVETTGSTDTYMHAYNSGREEITTDDDSGENYNARITISVSANQTYYFKVRGYSNEIGGPYSIVANFNTSDLSGTSMSFSIPLRFGYPVGGNISGGREYWYSVRPVSNGYVSVETTGSTNTFIHAYNANGDELATNDNSGEGNNAKLAIAVSANRTYYFKVRGYSSSSTGAYRIVANFSVDPGGESMAASIPLEFGSPIPGDILYSGGECWYSVRPAEHGSVTIETTGYTSTYMRAFNAGGTQIASADSGGEERNARIILLVSANHIYYFRVSGVGPYRIVAAFTSMYDSTPLEFGSPVAGNISGGREYWYSVTPTTNGNIAVETTGSADTYMFVYNAEWEELAHDDRGGQGRNARIIIFASANQTYYFRVKGVRSYVTGPYHVVANFFANPGDGRGSGMSSSIPLEFGFPVPGNILGRTGIECWYSVTPTSNGNITVETTGSTDTYMYAYNAGGVELAHNDDGGQGSNARITIPVSANQTYYFKVRGFGSGTTGSYSVVANFSAN